MTGKTLGLLLAGCSTLAIAHSAAAQTAPAPTPSTNSSNEVVVTGSRVIKNGNNSPTPVTVVAIDDALKLQPTTVADALNDLPQFSGSKTQTSNPQSGTTIQMGGGNSSGQYLNLRNLGAVRTLILVDGLRVPPTSANGLVDVDEIPTSLLQRVDVVTGGSSAVYGSDAVAGVVNYITDRNFNGLKLNASAGETQIGDDRNYKFGIAAGHELFGGKGHIEASYDYYDDNGVPYRYGGARDPGLQIWSIQGNGTTANPYFETPGARQSSSTFGGLITSNSTTAFTGVDNYMTFDQNGVLSPFVHGTPTITPATVGGTEIGGDGIYYNTAMKASQLQNQFFSRLDYDFTDTMHGYVAVSASDKVNTTYFTWQSLGKAVISATDPFLAPAYQAQFAAAKQTSFLFSKQMMDTPRTEPTTNESVLYVDAGLQGEINSNYKWNFGIVHSTSVLTLTNTDNVNNGRMDAALDAVKDPASGNIVCHVTLTNPSLYPGCIPLNPFGPTSDSPAAMAWIEQSTNYVATTSMDDVSGAINGAPFSTWAGPVNTAVSGEWRKVSFSSTTNASSNVNLDCTGLIISGTASNCTATSKVYNNTTAPRSLVSETVAEGALEADVPLLKDAFLAQSLSVNGGVRYTDYSISGSYTTWKVGVDWHVNDEVRFRGTRSHDIRAPTLDDLYAPTSISVNNGTTLDQLTLQNVTGVQTITTGNPNLKSEIGDTWTGGVVLRPKMIPGFSLSVDLFDITVNNAIFPILAGNATINRACIASGGLSPYCQTIVRPFPYSNTTPANNLTAQYMESINVAEQFTDGIDFEANYATRVLDRPATVRWLTTYQPNIQYFQPQSVTLNQAGAAFGNNAITSASVWRGSIYLHYVPIDNVAIDTLTTWRTGLHPAGDPTLVFASGNVPPASFTNLTLTYTMKSDLGASDLFFSIQDLFNPPLSHVSPFTNLSPGQQYNYPASDPGLGRAFTIGLRFKH